MRNEVRALLKPIPKHALAPKSLLAIADHVIE